ncbi:hypothetical protein TYRP_020769 [Tyrophagus putrescentiae]|nr:hypothetical protein TYRP_020769 [Tyrophagus putrescentiae]
MSFGYTPGYVGDMNSPSRRWSLYTAKLHTCLKRKLGEVQSNPFMFSANEGVDALTGVRLRSARRLGGALIGSTGGQRRPPGQRRPFKCSLLCAVAGVE